MRALRIVLAGAVAAAGVLLTAPPASAVCDPVIYEVTGRCENSCTIAGKAYRAADEATGDELLPDPGISCAA